MRADFGKSVGKRQLLTDCKKKEIIRYKFDKELE